MVVHPLPMPLNMFAIVVRSSEHSFQQNPSEESSLDTTIEISLDHSRCVICMATDFHKYRF